MRALSDANIDRAGNQAFGFADRASAHAIWTEPLRGGRMMVRGDIDGDEQADFALCLVNLLATDGSSLATLQGIFVL